MCSSPFSRRWARARPWIFLACAVIGGLVLALKAPYGAASTYDFGAYRGLAGFFTGALVTRIPRLRLGGLAEAATLAAVIAFVHFAVGLELAPVVFAAAVYVFAWSDGPLSRMLNWRPVAKLGEWSYSIYMIHAAVLASIWAIAPLAGVVVDDNQWKVGLGVELAIYAAYTAVLVAGSAASYTLIEKPGRAWFNRLAAARKAPAEPAAVQP